MLQFRIFYAVLLTAMVIVSGCGSKTQSSQPEGVVETSNAKSMTQDATKGDNKAIDIEPTGQSPTGKRFALIVGVNIYDRNGALDYCVQDAEALRERLIAAGFMPQDIVMLTDNARQGSLKPSQTNIEVELDEMLGRLDGEGKQFISPGRLKEGDLIVLAFSGHGAHVDGKSYFCPTNAVADRPEATMVSIDRIFKRLELSPAQHKVMFVDACRNNPEAIPSGTKKRSTDQRHEMTEFTKSLDRSKVPGMFLIQSCRPGQVSIESDKLKHGLFSHFLLEGMVGHADADHNGQITVMELISFIDSRMEAWPSGTQRPTITTPPNATNFNLFPSALKPIKLELLVKEGHRDGMLVENAKVELTYTSSDGTMERTLATGKTDSDGQATLDVSWYEANTGNGSYHITTINGSKSNRTLLERFPDVKQYTLYAPVQPPEKLMTVTLECDEGYGMAVWSLLSMGVDIVNLAGDGANSQACGRSFTFEYLPGAVLLLSLGEQGKSDDEKKVSIDILLSLQASDNGKTLSLRFSGPCVYINNELAFIDFKEINNPSKWIQDGLPKHTDNFLGTIAKLFDADKRKDALRFVVIGTANKYLPVLQWLKSSGVGIAIIPDTKGEGETKKVMALSQAYDRSLVEMQPKHLLASGANVPLSDLTNLESLFFGNDSEDAIHTLPLEKLSNLKHLLLEVDCTADWADMAKLTKLKSLTLNLNTKLPHNLQVLSKIPQLQMLTIHTKDKGHVITLPLHQLPRLQHLAAPFPTNTDFSFTEKMPYLQTLGICNIKRAHNLTPLTKHQRLKCLAFAGMEHFDKISEFENVKNVNQSRPDLTTVEYFNGICLGSLWLFPLMILAGITTWLIRRRR